MKGELLKKSEMIKKYSIIKQHDVSKETILEFIDDLISDIDQRDSIILELIRSGNVSDDKTTEIKNTKAAPADPIPQDVKDALNMKVDLFNLYADTKYLAEMTLEEIYDAKGDKKAQSKFKWLLGCNTKALKDAAWKVQTFKINGRAA